jgi:hypothetical protein
MPANSGQTRPPRYMQFDFIMFHVKHSRNRQRILALHSGDPATPGESLRHFVDFRGARFWRAGFFAPSDLKTRLRLPFAGSATFASSIAAPISASTS